MTITEFLTARYDEDEAVARAASPGPWHTNAERDEVLAVDDIVVAEGFALSGPQTRATTQHIARHDPAYVLADIAAKRAIVKSWRDPFGNWTAEQADAARAQKERTLILLAQPYAEHPDFDPAWSVT